MAIALTLLWMLQLTAIVVVAEVGTHTRKERVAYACGQLVLGLVLAMLGWWLAVIGIQTWRILGW